MEKKTYWVAVQAPVFKGLGYFLKSVRASSMERAKKIVAGYCNYHNKRHGFSGDEIFRVVSTPISYGIKIWYNPNSTSVDLIYELFDRLANIELAHATTGFSEYKTSDDSTQALLLLDGEIALKEEFVKVLEPCKADGLFIDYAIKTFPYDASCGTRLKSFTAFKRQ